MLATSLSSKRSKQFFSLPELLVVVLIILVLSAIAIPVVRSTRLKALVVSCMNNLRSIAVASSHYQREYRSYPPQPYRGENKISATLAEYVEDGGIFHCPVDTAAGADSYSGYFVTRTASDSGDSLLVGCPRHDNSTLAINVFKKGAASTHPVGDVYHAIGGNESERKFPGDEVGCGTTYFPDGSSMTITTPGLEAEIIESFRLDSGQTYTLLRVPSNDAFGKLILDVTPGSKFEVITPAAIAGVRGTVFMVDIFPLADGKKGIDVFVYEGKVAVTEKTGKESWAYWRRYENTGNRWVGFYWLKPRPRTQEKRTRGLGL